MPRPAANMTVAKTIGEVEIYEDLQNLPDDEAVKKSLARMRNQRAKAAKGEDGGISVKMTRKARQTGGGDRAVSARAMREFGAVPMPEEAKAILERHKGERDTHEAARADMHKRHEEELKRVHDLAAFIAAGDKIDASGKLTKAARAELAAIK